MFGNLSLTFYNNVVAAYEEYAQHRDAPAAGRDRHLRTALAASTALYHFREHLPEGLRINQGSLESSSADYELLRGVTNALKHGHVTRFNPLVRNADDIKEVTVVVRYSDNDGEYSHVKTKIIVECTDGTNRWLDPAITRILNHWGMVLKDADVVDYRPRSEPEEPGSRFVGRDEASSGMTLEAMRGLAFEQSMQLLRFDPDLGRAIPLDLTGAELQFRIFKPAKQTADFTLTHPNGQEVTASIELTGEENAAFCLIETEADHEAFMEKVFQTHKDEIAQKLKEQLQSNG